MQKSIRNVDSWRDMRTLIMNHFFSYIFILLIGAVVLSGCCRANQRDPDIENNYSVYNTRVEKCRPNSFAIASVLSSELPSEAVETRSASLVESNRLLIRRQIGDSLVSQKEMDAPAEFFVLLDDLLLYSGEECFAQIPQEHETVWFSDSSHCYWFVLFGCHAKSDGTEKLYGAVLVERMKSFFTRFDIEE